MTLLQLPSQHIVGIIEAWNLEIQTHTNFHLALLVTSRELVSKHLDFFSRASFLENKSMPVYILLNWGLWRVIYMKSCPVLNSQVQTKPTKVEEDGNIVVYTFSYLNIEGIF